MGLESRSGEVEAGPITKEVKRLLHPAVVSPDTLTRANACNDALKVIKDFEAEAVAKVAAASETQRWIPIGESLPAIGKNVAILISDKSVAIEDWPTSGYLYPGVEWWAGVPGNYINLAGHKWNVTAWMPLPEAKK